MKSIHVLFKCSVKESLTHKKSRPKRRLLPTDSGRWILNYFTTILFVIDIIAIKTNNKPIVPVINA